MNTPRGRYKDRFDASAYADDEPVGVFVHADDPDAVWVPERLFWRLVFVGRAYSLHLLPLLGGHESVTLNRAQVENLLDEVAFVAALLSADPLVAEQATRLDQYLRQVLAAHPDEAVTVEGG
jgi:hypothetical protein